VAHARKRFFVADDTTPEFRPGRGGRRRSLLTREDEISLVQRAVVAHHMRLGSAISVRHELEQLLLERFNGGVAKSTISAIMRRVAEVWFPGRGSARIISNQSHLLFQQWRQESRRQVGMY
jgi:hypothetical protein